MLDEEEDRNLGNVYLVPLTPEYLIITTVS